MTRADDADAASRLAYLEQLVGAVDVVLWEFDWSLGAFTWVGGAADRMLGFDADEWLRPGFWLERLHPDDVEWAPSYCMAATQDGRDHEFEYRMIHKDGHEVWVQEIVTVDPVHRMSGSLRGVMVDVSRRKQAEVQAADRSRDLDVVLGLMRDLYLRVSPDGAITDLKIPGELAEGGEPRAGNEVRVRDVFAYDVAAVIENGLEMAHDSGAMVISEFDVRDARSTRRWEARFLPLESEHLVVLARDVTEKAEAMLRLERAKERYRTLVDMSPYAVFVTTLDYGVLFANDAAATMLGVADGSALTGVVLNSLTATSDCGEWSQSEIHRVEAEMRSWREGDPAPVSRPARCAMRRLDGGIIDVERSIAGVFYEGRPALMVLARDVTDDLEAERMTREYEQRYSSVIAQAPFGIHIYEMRGDDLVLAGANAAADRLLGVAHRPQFGRRVLEAFPNLAGTGVPETYLALANEGGTWHVDAFPYEDNEISGVYEVNAFQMSAGSVAVVFGDITERVRSLEKLRESETLLRSAQSIARVGHYVFDVAADSWTSSEMLDEIFGIGDGYRRDVQGWLAIVHEEDRESMLSYFTDRVISRHEPFDRQYRVRRIADGVVRWVHGRGELECDDSGAPVRHFGTIQDISDIRESEVRERRYAERLSMMAADLSATEDRERRLLAEELHDRVGQSLSAARIQLHSAMSDADGCSSQAAREVDALLESALQETRSLVTRLAPPMLYEIGLGAALRWQCDDLEHRFGLRIELDSAASDQGVTDEAKATLFRAAHELLVNVYKHSGQREAHVSLEQRPGWLQLTVRDEGRGFDTGAAGPSTGGSGFGLFSIRDRLPHLGGEFELESTPGGGTLVRLRVPRRDD